MGVEFRYAQLHMIAAGPGTGKSVMALKLALEAGIPTLYFSMDSDAGTQYTRAASMITGEEHSRVQDAVARGQTAKYDAALSKARHIRFVFDSNPSIDEMNEHLLAYGYAFGHWPCLIIVDNISDIFTEAEETAGLIEAAEWLKALAAKTGACIVALHHLTGEYDSGDTVAPLSALRGKISKKPVLILTLNRVPENPMVLNVAVVKNRGGIANARGDYSCWLGMDLSRMWLEGRLPQNA